MTSKSPYQSPNRNGTSRHERFLKAQSDEYFLPEERNLVDLMAFMPEYARMVSYFNSENQAFGNWRAFLLKDISFFLAQVATIDLAGLDLQLRAKVTAYEEALSYSARKDATFDLFRFTAKQYELVDLWYRHLSKINDTAAGESVGFDWDLDNAIHAKFAPGLRALYGFSISEEAKELWGHEFGIRPELYHKFWQIESAPKDSFFEGNTPNQRLESVVKKLWLNFQSFFQSLTYLVGRAKYHWEVSIHHKQNHPPHTALLIASLSLYKHAAKELNKLTGKHLDFYYYNVLGLKERAAQPDRTYVHFELAPHIPVWTVVKDTDITTADGIFSDNPVVFQTERDLKIYPSTIAEVKTLYFSKNPLIGVESSYQLISNIYSANIANSKDGNGKPFLPDEEPLWSPLGEEQIGKLSHERSMTNAQMGFAISDPILFLREGQRKVRVELRFDATSMGTFLRLVRDVAVKGHLNRENAFYKIFLNAFNISLTEPEGWMEVEKYTVLPPDDLQKGEMYLEFELEPQMPPVGAYDPEVHGPGLDTHFPVLRVTLNPSASVYSYSLLKDVELTEVRIDVSVTGIRDLMVFNEYGRQETSQPFQIFGFAPKVGTYLLIGNEELFRKTTTWGKITIEWHELPTNPMGLAGHYEAYGAGINNHSHKVALSLLSKRQFMPEESLRPKYSLFETMPNDLNALSRYTHWELEDLESLGFMPNHDFQMPPDYNHRTSTGFFRIELTDPPIAFGHDQYPGLFAEIATQNSLPPRSRIPFIRPNHQIRALPNTPFSPMIRSLSLDYKASSVIPFLPSGPAAQARMKLVPKIFHYHPFGIIETFSKGYAKTRRILPDYPDTGYLFLGFKDLKPPARISLLFILKNNSASDTAMQNPQLTWSYLSDNQWRQLHPVQILQDNTDGFTKSGIVEIDIPSDISAGNAILHQDLFWVCASVKAHSSVIAQAKGIFPNAVAVKRKDSESMAEQVPYTTPEKLEALVEYDPAIQSISQPIASSSGKPAEDQSLFYLRISERLRHKQRAATPWDYERLVLERFPEIYQAKCLPYSGNEAFMEKANMIMIVAPQPSSASKDYHEPKVSFGTLQAIKQFLETLSTPFLRMDVINPTYEKLKITCGVVFKEGKNEGVMLERLNRDIKRFIAPWMFGESPDLPIGGTMSKNALLTFIGNLPYIKFVTKFSIVQVINKDGYYYLRDTARDVTGYPIITASTPWAVLVPLDKHPIAFLDREAFLYPEPAGIDTMIIGTDFVIKEDDSAANNERWESKPKEVEDDNVYFLTLNI